MLWLEILLLVGIIAYSAKLGGIGVGMAGAVGMIAATAVFGLKPGFIPVDVMLIIMTVILAISVMQRAGGLAFMVKCAEKLLRNNPKYINALAPAVCFMLTTLGGTGYMAMSVLNVIQEVAKENNVPDEQCHCKPNCVYRKPHFCRYRSDVCSRRTDACFFRCSTACHHHD